jgi:hypothetical protein
VDERTSPRCFRLRSTASPMMPESCVIDGPTISGVSTKTEQKALGQACTTHPECRSGRCDNRSGAGCVSQDGKGEADQFCTTHQQCHSGYCQLSNGLRGTCSKYNLAINDPCHVATECASLNCVKGVCAQPRPKTRPATSIHACAGGKYIEGYTYKGQPDCASQTRSSHPSAYLTCDETGFYCCESARGANTKCGSDRWTFPADCMAYCASAAGNCRVGPVIRDGIFYGCYSR